MYIELSSTEIKALEMQTLKLRLWTALLSAVVVGGFSLAETVIFPGKAELIFATVAISFLFWGIICAKDYFWPQFAMIIFWPIFILCLFGMLLLRMLGLIDPGFGKEFIGLIIIFWGAFWFSHSLLNQ